MFPCALCPDVVLREAVQVELQEARADPELETGPKWWAQDMDSEVAETIARNRENHGNI